MARKPTVTPEGYSPIEAGKAYPALVCDIEKKSKPRRFELLLRNLHPAQDGR